jgi:hypothetical protein
MRARDRSAHHERCSNAKLTVEAVRDIYTRVAAGETQVAVAADYGVNASTVSLIATGKTWERATRALRG